jgi:hypothetical protein
MTARRKPRHRGANAELTKAAQRHADALAGREKNAQNPRKKCEQPTDERTVSRSNVAAATCILARKILKARLAASAEGEIVNLAREVALASATIAP